MVSIALLVLVRIIQSKTQRATGENTNLPIDPAIILLGVCIQNAATKIIHILFPDQNIMKGIADISCLIIWLEILAVSLILASLAFVKTKNQQRLPRSFNTFVGSFLILLADKNGIGQAAFHCVYTDTLYNGVSVLINIVAALTLTIDFIKRGPLMQQIPGPMDQNIPAVITSNTPSYPSGTSRSLTDNSPQQVSLPSQAADTPRTSSPPSSTSTLPSASSRNSSIVLPSASSRHSSIVLPSASSRHSSIILPSTSSRHSSIILPSTSSHSFPRIVLWRSASIQT